MSEVRQLGRFRIGAGDDQRRHAHDVGGKPRRIEIADMGRGRDQHLAAEMAAFLLRGQLVLEMDAGRARLDIGLHDLEGVERPAEAGLGIGDDRREPGLDRKSPAFCRLDLVGALQRAVDALGQLRAGIGRIERLVRIHGRRGVGVGGDLPAREIDRLQPGAHHLHRLVAGDGAERIDEILLVHELPQAVGAHFGQRIADRDRAAQTLHIVDANRAARCRRSGPLGAIANEVVKISHASLRALTSNA